MLPPFRVRNSNSGRSRLAKTDFDAVVRICAPDYDLTVQACPEAKLKYFDEEDGEIVTVGSSFELVQCLESPLRQPPQYHALFPGGPRTPSNLDFSETLYSPSVHQYHVFNIEDRPSSLQLWGEIQHRSKRLDTTLRPRTFMNGQEKGGSVGTTREPHLPYLSGQHQRPLNVVSGRLTGSMMGANLSGFDTKVHLDASDDLSRLQELEAYRKAPDKVDNTPQTIPLRKPLMTQTFSKHDLKVDVDSFDASPSFEEIGDPRVAYFNASNSPRSKQRSIPALCQMMDAEANSKTSCALIENPSIPSASAYPAFNPTFEGKRQAQTADDNIRTRVPYSPHGRGFSSLLDVASYQNRRASYSQSAYSYRPGNLTGFAQFANEPKSGMDCQRQQAAADNQHFGINSLPYTKPLRGSHDYGDNKNPLCFNAGLRSAPCDDHHKPVVAQVQAVEAGGLEINDNRHLLNLFEAELARFPSRPGPCEEVETTGTLGIYSEVAPILSTAKSQRSVDLSTQDMQAPLDQICSDTCIRMLELGLRTALSSFDTCIHTVASSVVEASVAVRSAEKSRIESAIASFRRFASEIEASGKALGRGLESRVDQRGASSLPTDEIDQRVTWLPTEETLPKISPLPMNEIDDQPCKSGCTVFIWPVGSFLGSKEIKDILVLHSDQVKSVLLLQMDKEPLRMAMCAMEDDCSAKIFARSGKIVGQTLSGQPLLATTAFDPEESTAIDVGKIPERVASSPDSPLLAPFQRDDPLCHRADRDASISHTEVRYSLASSTIESDMISKTADNESADLRNHPNFIKNQRPAIQRPRADKSIIAKGSNEQSGSSSAANRVPPSKKLEPTSTFPPLPSMEALIPQMSYTSSRVAQLTKNQDSSSLMAAGALAPSKSIESNSVQRFEKNDAFRFLRLENFNPPRSKPEPSTLRRRRIKNTSLISTEKSNQAKSNSRADGTLQLANPPDATESSGEFFNRMTGLCYDSTASIYSSPRLEPVSVAQDAQLVEEKCSPSDQAMAYRYRTTPRYCQAGIGVDSDGRWLMNIRQPHPENVSGEGAVAWDSSLNGSPMYTPMKTHRREDPMLLTPKSYQEMVPMPVAPTSNQGLKPTSSVIDLAPKDGQVKKSETDYHTVHHSDATSVRKVQECVTQLHNLGFGGHAEGSMGRLVIYAQAADGDLVGAIDIIDEEQRAHRERLHG